MKLKLTLLALIAGASMIAQAQTPAPAASAPTRAEVKKEAVDANKKGTIDASNTAGSSLASPTTVNATSTSASTCTTAIRSPPAPCRCPKAARSRANRPSALMDSTFEPDPQRRRVVTLLHGEIPDAFDLPSGCAYAARCPHASARCGSERPALTQDGAHSLACHHPIS